jgi:acyl carrier protein
MKILAALAIGAFFAALYWCKESTRQVQRGAALFIDREPLSIIEFHERYFKSKGVPLHIVERILKILEQQFRTDMSRLSGADTFENELKGLFDDELIDVAILNQLEKTFAIQISDVEASQVQTVSDLVELVASKVEG